MDFLTSNKISLRLPTLSDVLSFQINFNSVVNFTFDNQPPVLEIQFLIE